MTKPVLLRRVACALALVVTGAVAFQAPAATSAWSTFAEAQWHLDVEGAMDAAGVASGMVIGEAGAGDGFFTLPMARRIGPAGLVYANDISTRALQTLEERAARAGLANVRTVVGDVADPRFPRRDLQLIVIVHAFHDFSQPVEWLVSAKGYLRQGGAVAVIDRDPEQGAESHFWTRARIEGYAAEAGYELASASDASSGHLILVFKPKPR